MLPTKIIPQVLENGLFLRQIALLYKHHKQCKTFILILVLVLSQTATLAICQLLSNKKIIGSKRLQ